MADFEFSNFMSKAWLESLCFITAEEKKEPTAASSKKEDKNDSDSEDEGKKERQRFKSERPKEQHKFEKQEQSMWKTNEWMAVQRFLAQFIPL